MQLCSKPSGARRIEPETRRRGQLLSRPPTTGPDVHLHSPPLQFTLAVLETDGLTYTLSMTGASPSFDKRVSQRQQELSTLGCSHRVMIPWHIACIHDDSPLFLVKSLLAGHNAVPKGKVWRFHLFETYSQLTCAFQNFQIQCSDPVSYARLYCVTTTAAAVTWRERGCDQVPASKAPSCRRPQTTVLSMRATSF